MVESGFFISCAEPAGQPDELGILIDEFLIDFVGGFGSGTGHEKRVVRVQGSGFRILDDR